MSVHHSANSNAVTQTGADFESLLVTLRRAAKKIAPVWPLESFVAVNPYLGLADRSFDNAAHELAVAGGVQMTLPVSFFLEKMEEEQLRREHIARALERKGLNISVDEFLDQLLTSGESDSEQSPVLSVAEVAGKITDKDLKRFVTNRVTDWAASYFDKGQAVWSVADQDKPLFAAWKEVASLDLTPEIIGMRNFRKFVKSLPDEPLEAADKALLRLGIPDEGLDLYLHSLLLRFGGWSAYAARLDWDRELYGGDDGTLIEFLSVLLCWEAGMLESFSYYPRVEYYWNSALKSLPELQNSRNKNRQLTQKLVLQEAFDIAVQSELIQKFDGTGLPLKKPGDQSKAQAVFCIDVRSEVYRRNLELVDNNIETLGFAGFFAFPIKYVPLAHDSGEAQCPVLLTTGPTIMEEMSDQEEQNKALNSRVMRRQVQQVWKSFKSGAVTCFSFVSPVGLSYLPKLFTDSFGLTRPVPHPETAGLSRKHNQNKRVSLNEGDFQGDPTGIPLADQVAMAKNALTAMSLKDNFARFVLIMGHGSSMVNNPHATGYDCGACGGHTGEANARVAAAVLNNPEVRLALQKEGISIPGNTVFLACLHDTTTDEVKIFNEYDVPATQQAEFKDLRNSLLMAGQATRAERSLRLAPDSKSSTYKSILARSKDWSQTRPEWGLAGCSAFVVAPRERTQGIDLGGRSFLHSYDWKQDEGFGVLELIMTAPMVVTSWISLQYFASTVDNKIHGSGNKTLHNVTSGLGVLEGYSGDLRVGLPWQAVHDGENYQHEPVKLNVIIEAPLEAMNNILNKHEAVRDLVDNGWINLLAMDEQGVVSHRYSGKLSWEEVGELVG